MAEKHLKLFLWEDVLTSYPGGLVLALAYDEATARQLVSDAYTVKGTTRSGNYYESCFECEQISGVKPKVITKPFVLAVSGGN